MYDLSEDVIQCLENALANDYDDVLTDDPYLVAQDTIDYTDILQRSGLGIDDCLRRVTNITRVWQKLRPLISSLG